MRFPFFHSLNKMPMSAHSPDNEQLISFLNTLEPIPNELIEQLNKNFTVTVDKWMKRSKEDWEKIAGMANGIDIYNHLHPAPQASLSPTSSESAAEFAAGQFPHPARKRRWEQLNEILLANKKYKLSLDSTAYSYVEWKDVKEVFSIVDYVQKPKPVPDDVLAILTTYLTLVTKCFGVVRGGKEAKRVHFIAPIIVCVCQLFNGDIILECEEDLNGNFVRAHGHFEFVLRRGNRRVCIVEAKKDDMDQGLAQDLLGCEVAADVGKTNTVYGIVTNYYQWYFLRSFDERIELEETSMATENHLPEPSSMANIAGKIYAMLSDE